MANIWVQNMTGGTDSESDDTCFKSTLEIRPSRLGLGAKYLPHSQATSTITLVEKKLRSQIDASQESKSPASDNMAAGSPQRTDSKAREFMNEYKGGGDEEDHEDSRASVFRKKYIPSTTSNQLVQAAGIKKKKGRKKTNHKSISNG